MISVTVPSPQKDIVTLAARDPVVSTIKPQRLVIDALPGLSAAIDEIVALTAIQEVVAPDQGCALRPIAFDGAVAQHDIRPRPLIVSSPVTIVAATAEDRVCPPL